MDKLHSDRFRLWVFIVIFMLIGLGISYILNLTDIKILSLVNFFGLILLYFLMIKVEKEDTSGEGIYMGVKGISFDGKVIYLWSEITVEEISSVWSGTVVTLKSSEEKRFSLNFNFFSKPVLIRAIKKYAPDDNNFKKMVLKYF